MRWPPIVLDVGLTVVMWAAVLWILRAGRTRMAAHPSPHGMRSRRLRDVAAIAATVGVTWLIAWFITDATGPPWLHTLSAPTSLVFIAIGAVLAGYAGWVAGR